MTTRDERLQREIAALKQRFDEAPKRARDERDQSLRDLAKKYDLRQVDLVRLTGYSRETVRQALNPEVRDAIRVGRRKETRTRESDQR